MSNDTVRVPREPTDAIMQVLYWNGKFTVQEALDLWRQLLATALLTGTGDAGAKDEAVAYLLLDIAPDGSVMDRELSWTDHCSIYPERQALGFDMRSVPLYTNPPTQSRMLGVTRRSSKSD